jgi:hypothetical protein
VVVSEPTKEMKMSQQVQNPRAKEIAETIYSQFGGRRAASMIGMCGQGFGTDENGNAYLSFKFKAGRKANYCKITLTPADLYDMTIEKVSFGSSQGLRRKVVAEHKGIFCDQLAPLFEEATGLYLRLF